MIADVTKLVNKICIPLYCQIKAEEYGITNCCDELDPKASIFLWLANSGCTLTKEMECQINDYIALIDIPCEAIPANVVVECNITVFDVSPGVTSCTQTPIINILL